MEESSNMLYGKKITIVSIENGEPTITRTGYEQSIIINSYGELLTEIATALEPIKKHKCSHVTLDIYANPRNFDLQRITKAWKEK